MSLHVPDGSVFVFSTDPTRAGLRWDKDKSEANKVGRILVRVPASDGLRTARTPPTPSGSGSPSSRLVRGDPGRH